MLPSIITLKSTTSTCKKWVAIGFEYSPFISPLLSGIVISILKIYRCYLIDKLSQTFKTQEILKYISIKIKCSIKNPNSMHNSAQKPLSPGPGQTDLCQFAFLCFHFLYVAAVPIARTVT